MRGTRTKKTSLVVSMYLPAEILFHKGDDGVLEVNAGTHRTFSNLRDALGTVRPHLFQRLISAINRTTHSANVTKTEKMTDLASFIKKFNRFG